MEIRLSVSTTDNFARFCEPKYRQFYEPKYRQFCEPKYRPKPKYRPNRKIQTEPKYRDKNTPVAMRKVQAITIFVNASSFMSWKLGQIFIWQDWILRQEIR